MAIRIVEGVPGSGKTYYAVHHLVSNYFRWDTTADAFVPKDKRTRVISNIDRFHLAEPLDELVRAAGGLAKFFSYAFQKTLAVENQIVYVIDEAQLLFPRSFRQLDVFAFFQKHRHLGMDVYLITQDVGTLALELRNLAEYYVRAVRRSFSMVGEFRYKFVGSPSDKTGFKTKVLKRDQRVFGLYSSMQAGESEKIRSAPLRYLALMVGLVVVCFSIIAYVVHGWYGPGRAKASVPAPMKAETVAKPPAGPSPVPKVVPESAPTWVEDGEVEVTGIVGAEETGSVFGLRHGERVERRWSFLSFVSLCRCHVSSLRAGDVVPAWRFGVASVGTAPSARGAGAGTTSPPRTFSPEPVRSITNPSADAAAARLLEHAQELGARTDELVRRAEKTVDSEKSTGLK